MNTTSKRRYLFISSERLNALSDGVFAIVMTLLILDVKIPLSGLHLNNMQLLGELKAALPNVYAYLIAFVVSAKYWQFHSMVVRNLGLLDTKLVWSNLYFLLFVTFLPFPTSIVGNVSNFISILLFNASIAIPALILYGISKQVINHPSLEDTPGVSTAVFKQMLDAFRHILLYIPGVALLSTLVGILSPQWATAVWLLLFFIRLTRNFQERASSVRRK